MAGDPIAGNSYVSYTVKSDKGKDHRVYLSCRIERCITTKNP